MFSFSRKVVSRVISLRISVPLYLTRRIAAFSRAFVGDKIFLCKGSFSQELVYLAIVEVW